MKARLIKTSKENGLALLLADGSYIKSPTVSVLGVLLFNFKNIEEFNLGRDSDTWTQEYPDMVLVPGHTLAYVTDSQQLVIEDITPFVSVFESVKATDPIEDVLTASEYAELHNKSVEQVKVFCRSGRIWGAKKVGRDWIIKANSPYPTDNRFSVGK